MNDISGDDFIKPAVAAFEMHTWECRIAAIAPDCKSGDFGLRWLKQAAQIFDLVLIASLRSASPATPTTMEK